ncbi:prepilin-type N-terminal cleavage/methylation domain-containing protein [uncultured Limosilactobacillus sp.]|uniref:prepilin-type N-terminal cleavage/methylation domain-containing protein n=1 Tax=uncultured Limosilactobacillus sp. TaxID=2837629 RepID=UPI0025F1B645|nr:prepilin-type N-terminal cleavage/methylation domain-containing protein [uncultured Limosilactobacillus sp.]
MLRKRGFTIIECIISLLVLVMIFGLVQMTIPFLGKLHSNSLKDKTDWYLFLERLEDPDYSFQLLEVTDQSLILTSPFRNDHYIVQGGKKAVYFKAEQGGYLPILVNYQPNSLHFETDGANSVAVTCKLKNGEVQHAKVSFKEKR